MVSIILPTHNRVHFLERAIQSVLSQTFSDWELIVVDDGSTHETGELIERLQKKERRIRYLRQEGEGLSAARNRGIREAAGEWLAFLDDDDQWLPTKLEKQHQVIQKNLDAILVYTRARMVDPNGKFLGIYPPEGNGRTYRDLCEKNFIGIPSSVLLRRDICLRAGMFRSWTDGAEDYDLWLRIFRFGRVVTMDELLTIYLRQPQSVSRVYLRTALGHSRALESAPASPSEGVSRGLLRRGAAVYRYCAAQHMLADRQFFRATRTILEALWLDPLVGLFVPWSRTSQPLFKLVRPVGLAGYCLMRGLFPL